MQTVKNITFEKKEDWFNFVELLFAADKDGDKKKKLILFKCKEKP